MLKPSNPTFISQGEFTSSTRYGIEVRDSYCYIAGWNNRLAIFNVSNPSLPDLVYSDYGSNDACDFDIIDDLIYIADFIHGFYIYNISEPTSPVALGSYSGYQAIDIKIREDLAYLATLDGLLILNVSDVLNPVYVNLYSTPDRIDGIVIDSNYMYIAGGTQGLIILDITDKARDWLGIRKPSWGKESLAHRLYKHLVAKHFEKDGWKVELEHKTVLDGSGHKMDVFATLIDKNGVQTAWDIEITLTHDNLCKNVVNGFKDPEVNKVIIVAKDPKALEDCKRKTLAEQEKHREQLEFRLISEFFTE